MWTLVFFVVTSTIVFHSVLGTDYETSTCVRFLDGGEQHTLILGDSLTISYSTDGNKRSSRSARALIHNCHWQVKCERGNFDYMNIRFTDFNLPEPDETGECPGYLQYRNADMKDDERVCGTIAPHILPFEGRMHLTYRMRSNMLGYSFTAVISCNIYTNLPEWTTESGDGPFGPLPCHPGLVYERNITPQQQVIIQSPGYNQGNDYPPIMSCAWNITCEPLSEHQVRLQCSHFELEETNPNHNLHRCIDWFKVRTFETAEPEEFCSTETPDVTSNAGVIMAHFRSDATLEYSGFDCLVTCQSKEDC